MKQASDIVDRIGLYEKVGFTRDQAIQIVQIEQLSIIDYRLTELNKASSPNTDISKKG